MVRSIEPCLSRIHLQSFTRTIAAGTYREGLIENWLKGTVPNNYTALIADVKTHEPPGPWYDVVNGSLWVSNVNWPAVHFGGWFDIFLIGQLVTFSAYQHTASDGAKGLQSIVIDPLGHCQKAAKYFPEHTIDGRTALAVLQASLFELCSSNFSPTSDARLRASTSLPTAPSSPTTRRFPKTLSRLHFTSSGPLTRPVRARSPVSLFLLHASLSCPVPILCQMRPGTTGALSTTFRNTFLSTGISVQVAPFQRLPRR